LLILIMRNEFLWVDSYQPQIIDNFLPENYFNNLCDLMMGTGMVWNWNDSVDYKGGSKNQFQLTHSFYYSTKGYVSPLSHIIEPFVDLLKVGILIRIKANLTTRTKTHLESEFHYDHEFVGSRLPDGTLISYTAIYYVNTNNGYTLFQSGEKVKSVANRIAIFNSAKLHKAVSCTDEKRRVVINFNYFTSKYGTIDQYQKSLKIFNEANA